MGTSEHTDQDRVKQLLLEAITFLCKSGLNYEQHLSVEGLLGITVDSDKVFLVNIRENFSKIEVSQEEETQLTKSDMASGSSDDEQSSDSKRVRKKRPHHQTSISPNVRPSPSKRLHYNSSSPKRHLLQGPSSHDEPSYKQVATGEKFIKQEPADSYGDTDNILDDDDVVVVQPESCDGYAENDQPYQHNSESSETFNDSSSLSQNPSVWNQSQEVIN